MPSVTISNVAVIEPVLSREETVTQGDGGATTVLTLTGYADRDAASLSAAAEVVRRIREMAASIDYKTVLVTDSSDSRVDGMYEIQSARLSANPRETNSRARLYPVSVTLKRLGGPNALGPNSVRRTRHAPRLQTNSWSITSTPLVALPVGAESMDVIVTTQRVTSDSATAQKIFNSSTGVNYVMTTNHHEHTTGEVKIWDTLGDADEADWIRVYSKDHQFASVAHLVIENGLIRFKSLHGGTNKACHTVEVWTGSAWVMVTDATAGDGVNVGAGGIVTDPYIGILVHECQPWRVKVEFKMFRSTSPFAWSKFITLDRGKRLGLMELETMTGTSVYMELGMVWSSSRFIVTRPATVGDDNVSVRDHTVQSSSVTMDNDGDNFMATWAGTSATAIGLGAARTTGVTFGKSAGGGFAFSIASTTSLRIYLGGVPYTATTTHGEAESGSLSGGATLVSTVANGSGGGNNQVLMDAVNESVSFNMMDTSSPTGTRVRAWFRLAASANASGTDALIMILRRVSDAATLASRTIVATDITVINSFQWFSVEYTSWNGTDVIRPLVACTVRGAGTNWYADEAVMLVLSGSSDRIKDVSNSALTEVDVWRDVVRASY